MILSLYSFWQGAVCHYCAAHDKSEARALFSAHCNFPQYSIKLHRIHKEPMHKSATPRMLGSREVTGFMALI